MSFFREESLKLELKHLLPLSYYGTFTRGIATGANSFFSLSLSRYKRLGLPRSALKHCITKSARLNQTFNSKDIQRMEKSDSNIFILDVKNTYDKSIKKYILYGEREGFHLRYLTSKRNPWYRIKACSHFIWSFFKKYHSKL